MKPQEINLAQAAAHEVMIADGMLAHAAARDEVLVVHFDELAREVTIRAFPRTEFCAGTGMTLRRALRDGALAAWIVAFAGDVAARFLMTSQPLALGGAA